MISQQEFNELDCRPLHKLNFHELENYVEFLKAKVDQGITKVSTDTYNSLQDDYTDLTNIIDEAHKMLDSFEKEYPEHDFTELRALLVY